jgi:hypothetical protein
MKADANSALLTLAGFAPIGLSLKAIYRFELVDWHWPLALAAAVGLPATFILFKPHRKPSASLLAMAIFTIPFCFCGTGSLVWSGLQFANDAAGSERVELHRIQIATRHEQRGKYDTMYSVTAVNPPDLNGITRFKLNKSIYDRLTVGGNACIEVWRGMLLLRWYRVSECEAGTRLVR